MTELDRILILKDIADTFRAENTRLREDAKKLEAWRAVPAELREAVASLLDVYGSETQKCAARLLREIAP